MELRSWHTAYPAPASYGVGLTKTVEKVSGWTGTEPIDGKNNYWTVTAAWLF